MCVQACMLIHTQTLEETGMLCEQPQSLKLKYKWVISNE